MLRHGKRRYFMHQLLPAVAFGALAGVLTAIVVNFYKLCAHHVIEWSGAGYAALRTHWHFIPLVLAVMFGVAWLFGFIYRNIPNLRGGGIPTSIGILRGIIPFKWLRNVVGVFLMSLTSFLFGVPVGNEGPSVQMGTALGRGAVYAFGKKNRAWDRYAMTGGACAGFSVATGAPISGVLFAVEEAHQRISPTILVVASTSVAFAHLTTELIAPVFGVSKTLFPKFELVTLSLRDVWIPLLVGAAIGLFAVLFLFYYGVIRYLFNVKLNHIRHRYRIFFVFALTLVLGLCSSMFISTGHDLILSLFQAPTALWLLAAALLVRSTLTFCANTNRLTGGIFLPVLAIGALLASLVGKGVQSAFGLSHEYYVVILVLGITACVSSMMKMPLTAIVFSVEALGCYDNIFFVIVVAAVSYMITEVFDAKSINDVVLDNRIEELNRHRTSKVIDTYVEVQRGAFAVGKQIRDIFWPANLFVLSVRHAERKRAMVDEHGSKSIHTGDVLHVRYSTYDVEASREELVAIVGEQEFCCEETDAI